MYYNEKLADDMNVSDENRVLLDETYRELFLAFDYPDTYEDVAAEVTRLEFKLQFLWGFPQDNKFHRYQQNIAGCMCPVIDNLELFGHSEQRYATGDCPWHGK